MFVSKLSVSGFKSFADSLDIELPQGIVAVVGPNGAGKSNIAEAVRWAFGEQKVARLRADHSSDVLFSGNAKRSRSGLAQVQLQFSNSSSKNAFSVTRKLYRGGESEYQLNGRSVKLSTLRQTLAKNGIATQSYSVINQGTIEQMVTGSDQQRTELFEEATGVRSAQMEKQLVESQLRSSRKQLDSIKHRIVELLPSARQLESYQKSNAHRAELQSKLDLQRVSYINQQRNSLGKSHQEINSKLTALKTNNKKLDSQLIQLKKQEASFDNQNGSSGGDSLQQYSEQLEKVRSELQKVSMTLMQEEQNKQQLESQLSGQRTIKSQLNQTLTALDKLTQKTSVQQTKVAELQAVIEQQNSLVAQLSQELAKIRKDLSHSQKKEYLHHALGLLRLLETNLNNPDQKHTVELALFKLKRMVQYAIEDNAAELALRISELQRDISKLMGKREEVLERHTHETIALRSAELDIVSLQQQEKQLKAKESVFAAEAKRLEQVEQSIKKLSVNKSKLLLEQTKLQNSIAESQVGIGKTTPQLHAFVKSIQEVSIKLAQNQAEQSQLHNELSVIEQEQMDLKELVTQWFGKNIPKLESQSQKVEIIEIEKTLAQLEVLEQQQPENLKELEDQARELEFLQDQSDDLDRSIQGIEKVLLKLENSISKRFKTAMASINKQFGQSFSKLFNGGSAQIILETNEADTKLINIEVTPPRKKTRQVTALSGGEKTLTSLALLSAIVSTNPAPVLVLDEVDAALDDANSQAFAGLLHDLAKHSQIIIITHNHATMQTANMLLGVTVAADGSSVVIPLTINQANQYAEAAVTH